MDNLGESIKKLLLAGVGAAATTAEKSKNILEDLAEKGALTVEQGKTINEELKHNIKETIKEHTQGGAKPEDKNTEEDDDEKKSILEAVGKMMPEELKALKDYLKISDKDDDDDLTDEDEA